MFTALSHSAAVSHLLLWRHRMLEGYSQPDAALIVYQKSEIWLPSRCIFHLGLLTEFFSSFFRNVTLGLTLQTSESSSRTHCHISATFWSVTFRRRGETGWVTCLTPPSHLTHLTHLSVSVCSTYCAVVQFVFCLP